MKGTVSRKRRNWQRAILVFELVIICASLALWSMLSVRPLGVIEVSFWAVATVPLALSAMTQTLPILAGGQGLAAGATAYLVSIIVAGAPISGLESAVLWVIFGLLLGGGIGAFNGLLIGYLRLPSTAVTISTGIAAGGFAQLLADSSPPAPPAQALSDLEFGHTAAGLPIPLLAAVAALAIAGEALRRSAWGHGLRLLGMRPQLAERMGVRAAALRASAYAIAGFGSAATGIVLAAQLGASDLFLGAPLLLQIYAAVAIGGSVPGLRGGSIVGSLLGAAVVTGTSNLLLPLGLDDYFSTACDGLWLILGIGICWCAVRSFFPEFSAGMSKRPELKAWSQILATGYVQAAAGAVLAIAVAIWAAGSGFLTLALAMAVLALGQGAVMRAGGLDLSMSAMIAFASVATVGLTQGNVAEFPAAIAIIMLAAIIVGMIHDWTAAVLGRVAIVVTLATAGVIHVAMAWIAIGQPPGFVPPELMQYVTGTGSKLPLAIVGILLIALAIRLDRRYGADPIKARPMYLLSSICSALFGVFAALLAGQASPGLIDPWLAPTFAAVVVGGVPFRGGSGSLLGVVGAAVIILACDTGLVRIGFSSEQRMIVLGLAMLGIVTLTRAIFSGAKSASIRRSYGSMEAH